ncbi:MAG TPA: hypothetical protein VM779_08745 [Thermoanaerobaculia bacterium]|nr:hypothetical protein [Thermoanaerobaculia bacterium]
MNITTFEPLLRDATVKALDAVGRKLASAEVKAENAITRLLNRWNALSPEEKEHVAAIVITTAATAVAAIAALKGSGKKKMKKKARRVVKKVARKVGG